MKEGFKIEKKDFQEDLEQEIPNKNAKTGV